MKVFWDTNILIDLISSRREDHNTALRLIEFLHHQKAKFIVTSLTLANADYLLSRYYDVINFKERFLILKSKCAIVDMTEKQAFNALKSNWNDFEDALQYQSALAADCDAIITRDLKYFKNSKIPIFTPEQYLNEFKK